MRPCSLLLLCALVIGSEASAQTALATVGAPPQVTRALATQPELTVTPLPGRPRTVAQALRSRAPFDLLLWIGGRGARVTAELYARSGEPLGFVKVQRRGRRWTPQSLAELQRLIAAHLPPAATHAPSARPAPEPVTVAEAAPVPQPEPTETLPPPAALSRTAATPVVAAQAMAAPASPSSEVAPAQALDVPAVELSLSSDVVWRTYELCPGTLRCGRQVFTSTAGLRFVTEQPYLGGTLALTAFPFQGASSVLDGVGLEARYARRFIEIAVPTTTGLTFVAAHEEEVWAELLYRAPAQLGRMSAWHGVRFGGGTRRFDAGGDPLTSSSLRGLGAVFGWEGGLALLGRWVRAEAGLSYVLGSSPGAGEREAYGGAIVGSDSLRARAALSGRFAQTAFGYGVTADYTRFVDSFFGPGARTSGASAREEYVTLSVSLRYRL